MSKHLEPDRTVVATTTPRARSPRGPDTAPQVDAGGERAGAARSDSIGILQLQRRVGNRTLRTALDRVAGGARIAAAGVLPRSDLDARAPIAQRVAIDVDTDRVDRFRQAHPGHDQLVAGIVGRADELQIVDRLIENFFGRTDFTYNFASSAVFGHRGDCRTLRNEFVTTAREAFGIEMQTDDIDRVNILTTVEQQTITGGQGHTGSVDGRWWYFDSHHWAVWNGRPIDVLFGQWGVVPHALGRLEYDGGMPIYRFPHLTFYLKHGARDSFDRYTTDASARLRLG